MVYINISNDPHNFMNKYYYPHSMDEKFYRWEKSQKGQVTNPKSYTREVVLVKTQIQTVWLECPSSPPGTPLFASLAAPQ